MIRKAQKSDINSLIHLLYQVQKVHSDARPDIFVEGARKYKDDEILEILEDETKPIFVAEIENKVVGYAFCIISSPMSHCLQPIKNLYIDDLCVDKEYRGNHIGTTLYEYVIQYAKEIHCHNVTLNVWADNKEALAFYEKIGLKIQKIGMEKIL